VDLWTLVRTVLRQWRVVAPVLLLTALTAGVLVAGSPNLNQTSASIILVPLVPNSSAVATTAQGAQGDPQAGSADLTAQALAAVVSSDGTVTALAAQGANAAYSVSVDASGPLLRVQAEGDSPEVAVGTARAVIDRVVAELDARQNAQGVAEDQRLRADVLAVPEGSRPGTGGSFTASGSVLLVGTDSRPLRIESNPYARLAESTSPVLSGLAQGQDFRRILEASGVADTEYQVDPDPRAAVVYLTATSPEAAVAERTANTLIGAFREELSARQTALGLPQDIWFTFTVLSPPTTEELPPDLLRSLVAIAGVGGLLALGAAVLAENWRARATRAEAPAGPLLDERPAPPRPIRTAAGVAPGAGPLAARGRGSATGGRGRAVAGDEAWMPAERK